MHDIRKSPRLMGHTRLAMEAQLQEATLGRVAWLEGQGLDAVYRLSLPPSREPACRRFTGTLTDLFQRFGLPLPELWQHALQLEAEEAAQ